MTALELGKKIRNGELTVRQVVEQTYEKIAMLDKELQSFLSLREKEEVLLEADEIQEKINSKQLIHSLAGVPIAIKDNICTKGITTTCASKMLEHFIPMYDATVIDNIKKAGMIIIGKTNMDEFAMGSTTKHSAFQITKNPNNTEFCVGGSSGGSAAAVASQMVPLSLGSDTGGSIRQPSAFCGIVGMKASYGLVSRNGLIAYASSMDQIGPMATNVSDCAALLEVIASYDSYDSTSVKVTDTQYTKSLINDVKGMKIGLLQYKQDNPLDESIQCAINQAKENLKNLGATVTTVTIPFTAKQVLSVYYVLACAEASSNLERYDGVVYGFRSDKDSNLSEMYRKTRTQGFGSEVKRRIMLGSFVLSASQYEHYYKKALRIREYICSEVSRLWNDYDVLLLPTTSVSGVPIKEKMVHTTKEYEMDCYTVLANLTKLPAISIPYGKDENGLPIGIQLMGNYLQEHTLFQVAYTLEKNMENKGDGYDRGK